MKSFFKKLAFVMALAMVVSLAAPAAAKADTLPLYLAYQDETDEIKVHKMTAIGETVDFCFKGAQTGWRELKRGWDSSDKTVATVDSNGLVTAVGYGSTMITFELEGYTTATALVEVKEATSFEVTQLTEKQVAFVFGGDVNYTAADIQLYYLIPLVDGTDFPLPWDFAFNECKNGTVKISALSQFVDGDRFKVVIGDLEPKEFTVKMGAIDEIQITQSAADVFVSGEDGDFTVTFDYKLLSGGVDLTNIYKAEADVRYELVWPTEDDAEMEFVFFDDSGSIGFYKEGIEALVKAIYTYPDAEGNSKTLESVATKVTSKKVTPWSLNNEVVDWCLVKTGTETGKANWNLKSVAADESENGEYYIVLRFKDSRGTEYVTDAAGKTDSKYVVIDPMGNNDKDLITENGYSFKFFSGNTDFMLVGSLDGTVSVYKDGTGYYYVARYKEVEGEPKLDAYVHASGIVVKEARYLAKIDIAPETVTVNAEALEGYSALTKDEVTISSKDQYGTDWHLAGTNVYTVTCSNEKINGFITATNGLNGDYGVSIEGHKVVLDGAKLFDYSEGATSFTFTVKETASGKTDTFKVTVKKPNYTDNTNATIKVDQVVSATYGNYNKVTVVADDIDIAADTANGVTTTDQKAVITLYKTSNTINVGQYENITTSSDIEDVINIVTDPAWKAPTSGVAAGTRYVVVYAPNGAIVQNVDWNADGDALEVPLAGDTDDKMWYADKGEYTVKVITVRYSTLGKNYNTVVTDKFTVSNSTKYDVSYVSKKVDKHEGTDINTIVAEALKFNLNGSEWKDVKANMIAENGVDYIVRDGYVIIKTVKFNVPVDGKTASLPWNQTTVKVNVSIETPNLSE